MPARSRKTRHEQDFIVARTIEMNLLSLLTDADEVARELGDSGCQRFVADARLAVELAERIDNTLVLPEPLETLDRPVLFLVALGVIGLHRACAKKPLPRERERLAQRLVQRHVRAAANPARLAEV